MLSIPRKGAFVIPALSSSNSCGEDEKPVPVITVREVAVLFTNTRVSCNPLFLAQLLEVVAQTCVPGHQVQPPGKLKKK